MSSGIAIDVWNGIAVHVIRCLTHFKRHTLLYCFCMTRPDGEMKNLPLQYFNADKSFVTAQKLSVHNYSKWHTQIAPNDSDRSGKGHDGEECGQLPHHVDIAWSMDFFLQSTVDWCEHVAVSCGSPIGHIIVWHEKFICFCNGFYTLQYCISRYIYLCHFLFCVTSARLFQHLRKLILLCTSDTAVERVNSMHWVNVVCVFLERERKTLCVRVCALEYEHVVCALRCCCFFLFFQYEHPEASLLHCKYVHIQCFYASNCCLLLGYAVKFFFYNFCGARGNERPTSSFPVCSLNTVSSSLLHCDANLQHRLNKSSKEHSHTVNIPRIQRENLWVAVNFRSELFSHGTKLEARCANEAMNKRFACCAEKRLKLIRLFCEPSDVYDECSYLV